jgi:hypothetical protein
VTSAFPETQDREPATGPLPDRAGPPRIRGRATRGEVREMEPGQRCYDTRGWRR